MAVSFRASAANATAGAPATTIAAFKPTGVVSTDVLIASVAVEGGAGVTITPPSGFTLVDRVDNGSALSLAVYVKTAGGSEPSTYTWTFGSARCAALEVRAYYNDGPPLRAWLSTHSGVATASGTSHATPAILTTSASAFVVASFAALGASSWTPPGGMTERDDVASSVGAADVCLSGADLVQVSRGSTGALTATLAAGALGCAHVLSVAQNGITQPAGAGGQINFEDDLQSATGLGYTAAEFSAAFPLYVVNLNNPTASYRFEVTMQNGDGVGSAKTTWVDTRAKFDWANGKTYLVNATGRSNRWTNWGVIYSAAAGKEPIGYDGIVATFGAATTISGNGDLGGCEFRNYQAGAAGPVFLLPTTVGCLMRVVDVDCYTGGTQAYGNANQPLQKLRRVTAAGFGAGNFGRIVQFNCLDADTIAVAFPSGSAKLSTGGQVVIKNPRFIGPSSQAELVLTGGGMLLNPEWSGDVVRATIASFETFIEFTGVVRAAGAAVAGALVQLYDKNNRLVVDARTDALGILEDYLMAPTVQQAPFGSPFTNAIAVEALEVVSGSNVLRYQGPWRLEVNGDGAIAGFPKVTQMLDASSQPAFGSDRQYRPLAFSIDLPAPAATAPVGYYQGDDVLPALTDAGASLLVTLGAGSTYGVLDERSVTFLEAGGASSTVGVERVVTIATGALPGLAPNVAIGVDGVTRYVAEVRQVAEGSMTEIVLADEVD